MLKLVVTGGDGPRLTFNLIEEQRVGIGRSHDNSVVLADSSVSRHHAELVPAGDDWQIRDLGSRNGTFLNGERVPTREKATLPRGSRIELGRYAIQVSIEREFEKSLLISEEPYETTDSFVVDASDPLTDPRSLARLMRGGATDTTPAHRLRCLLAIEKANLELLGFEPLHVLYGKTLDLVMSSVRPTRAALFTRNAEGEMVCEALRGDGDSRKMVISRSLIDRVMEKHLSILVPRARDSKSGWTDSLETAGVRSVMAAPLRHENRTVGLIYADAESEATHFGEDDLRVLTALANIAAARIAIGRLHQEERALVRHEQELHAAARVQRRLLPRSALQIPGYSLDGFNRPCYEVGGDFFDYVDLEGTRHGVVLADVAGKGLPAALLLMGVQAFTRAYLTLQKTVDGLGGFLNEAMLQFAPRNRFVSFFGMELDHEEHRVRWTNAGHAPSPVVVRKNGSLERLNPGGIPLGVLPVTGYPVGDAELCAGDLLFICSDGVTDAANPDEEPFGEERLYSMLERLAGRSPEEVRAAVLKAVEEHVQDTPHSDDLTVVVVRRDPTELAGSAT